MIKNEERVKIPFHFFGLFLAYEEKILRKEANVYQKQSVKNLEISSFINGDKKTRKA